MWSQEQDSALQSVKHDWDPTAQQDYRVDGPAGSGKTQIIAEIAGWDPDHTLVLSPTAKSASVLRRRGCADAGTIHHHLLYPTPSLAGLACARCHREFRDGDEGYSGVDAAGNDVKYVGTCCRHALKKVHPYDKGDVLFARREKIKAANLFIVDEASMVSDQLAEQILQFKVPTLAFGDSFQLRPVKGGPWFWSRQPDVRLTEIHRQARDNPVLALATRIRKGEPLPYGSYGDSRVIHSTGRLAELMDEVESWCEGQTIAGKKQTVLDLNLRYREWRGLASPLPEPGDKVICRENDYAVGVMNGVQYGVVTAEAINEADCNSATVEMLVFSLDGGTERNVRVPEEYLTTLKTPIRFKRDGLSQFQYSYAITCHSAQGSEWQKGLVVDESRCFREQKRNWLYTAITRFRQSVIVVR